MIVFSINDDDVMKYDVIFDNEKLNKLKFEIIEKCSLIEHKDYESTVFPKMYGIMDYLKYRNYSEKKVGIREYNDFYSLPEDIYRLTYDKYNFPYLVELIDKLLSGDITVLEYIYYKRSEKELIPIDKKIEALNSVIEKTSNDDTNKKIELLGQLSELIKQKEINKNQEDVDEYYKKVRKLIFFREIDTLKRAELERVLEFYNKEIDINQYLDGMILKYIKK